MAQKKRTRPSHQRSSLDELQFYGALGGAIAGALNHLQAAKNSLGVAAGAGVLNSRYQMTAQAAIYKSASEAFICIRVVLDDAKAIQDKVQGLNVLEDYPEAAKQVRESTKTLLLKVESKMLAVQLPTPDFKGVKDALGGTKETPLARGQGLVSAAAAITTGAITSAEAKQLSEMKNDVKACEAGFN
jgi:hypothetical protein